MRGAHSRRYAEWTTSSLYFSGSTTHATASTRGRSASTLARCSAATESTSGRSRIATSPSCPAACPPACRGRGGSLDPGHAEPGHEVGELAALVGGYPRDRLGGRRPPYARGTDLLASERVEERGFADAGPTDQGEDVGVARETRTSACCVPDARRGGRVETERRRRSDRLLKTLKASPEVHPPRPPTAARSSAASSRAALGAGTSASNRARSPSNSVARPSSSFRPAFATSSSIARSPKIASSSF